MPDQPKLYIDANLYLEFYRSKASEFKKLLVTLNEIAKSIIITEQITNEVCRNKLVVFRQSIDSWTGESQTTKMMLPEHLDDNTVKRIRKWNKERAELNKQLDTSKNDLQAILKDIFTAISESTDTVSEALKPLFNQAIMPNDVLLTKARLRKELGQPPGKKGDPLGDQLSWEIVLANLHETSELFIVSKDQDYASEYDKMLLLNPVLYNDLVRVKPGIKIHVFNKLSEALSAFDKAKKIASLPGKEEMKRIRKDETELILLPALKALTQIYGRTGNVPMFCPKCGLTGELTPMQNLGNVDLPLDSSALYGCRNCGATFEF